ncbi:MAG: InlB B-repeat-containing protein [Bacteroidales bacterium]|nr:InlB B-repeat-containing protein [Bacteroidales bacterium]
MKKFYLMIFAIVTLAGMLAISGCGKEKVYRVTFDANGGTGEMKEQAFAKERPQALVSNAFTRIGYLFDGWNTASDGSGDAYTDAQEIVLDEDITLFAQWKAHEWVDLGLPSGTKWATYNVGATKPEEYGDYFAWGETQPKGEYNWGTYKYCTADYDSENNTYTNIVMTKYNTIDGKTVLDAADDAATANWGSNWRMPTREELNELYSSCTYEWTTQNGVTGEKFTGPNGKSIFLPAAGYRNDSSLDYAGSDGSYWSSSLYSSDTYGAWGLYFGSGYCGVSGYYRYRGLSVRAVCQSPN